MYTQQPWRYPQLLNALGLTFDPMAEWKKITTQLVWRSWRFCWPKPPQTASSNLENNVKSGLAKLNFTPTEINGIENHQIGWRSMPLGQTFSNHWNKMDISIDRGHPSSTHDLDRFQKTTCAANHHHWQACINTTVLRFLGVGLKMKGFWLSLRLSVRIQDFEPPSDMVESSTFVN